MPEAEIMMIPAGLVGPVGIVASEESPMPHGRGRRAEIFLGWPRIKPKKN